MTPKPKVSAGSRELQNRLHNLLSNLTLTIAHVKAWPQTQSASDNTRQLGQHIREILSAAKTIEDSLKSNNPEYQHCWIPLDLLELLEHNGMKTDKEYGLNPDCFLRGLVKEATGQLTGLKRRKLALERLGATIQAGIEERQTAEKPPATLKRERDDDAAAPEASEGPPEKKSKSEG